MTIEIAVPDIGTDEVEVTEILVKIGDTITTEQSLISVEGDKASMEIPSTAAGTVTTIRISVGDKVKTGSIIMEFEASRGGEIKTEEVKTSSTGTPPSTEMALQEVAVPDIGNDEVQITELLVKVGDNVTVEQSLMTVEGDKASMEIPSLSAGIVEAIFVSVGDKVKTGSSIMRFKTEVAGTPFQTKITKADTQPTETVVQKTPTPSMQTSSSYTNSTAQNLNEFEENSAYAHATPPIRRLAREFGVNLAKVRPSGRKNRILREDVMKYIRASVQQVDSSSSNAIGSTSGGLNNILPWPNIDYSKFGEVETVEMGRIQKISGANLHRNWVTIPHVTQFDEADITALEEFRKQQNSELEKKRSEIKITPLVFILKAVAKALLEMPRFNSSLSPDAQTLTLKKYINIGVAVDTPNGLVVPVIRDVNKKGLFELSEELTEISRKARAGRLTGADMQGGCFTISSLGGIGGTFFTPIVNAPEVAILGISRSSIKPVWNGKEFMPKLMLPLALSFDHRVIDGADGARFITIINKILSDIRRLVM